jgi:hypothetical protein
MLSGRFQGFVPKTWAHFQDHILLLHTVCISQAAPLFAAARIRGPIRRCSPKCFRSAAVAAAETLSIIRVLKFTIIVYACEPVIGA